MIYFAGPVSSWTLVVVSIDRLLAIACPMRFPLVSQRRFQIFIIVLVYLYNMAYYSYLLVDNNLYYEEKFDNATNTTISGINCDVSDDILLYWLDLVNSSLLPFFSMMLTSFITIVFILKSRKKFSSIAIKSRKLVRDRKFAITSISLNVLFLILNMPSPVYGVFVNYVKIDALLNNFLGYFSLCCYYSYYATSFYMQLAVNSIVRERFWRFFKRKKPRPLDTNRKKSMITIDRL